MLMMPVFDVGGYVDASIVGSEQLFVFPRAFGVGVRPWSDGRPLPQNTCMYVRATF